VPGRQTQIATTRERAVVLALRHQKAGRASCSGGKQAPTCEGAGARGLVHLLAIGRGHQAAERQAVALLLRQANESKQHRAREERC